MCAEQAKAAPNQDSPSNTPATTNPVLDDATEHDVTEHLNQDRATVDGAEIHALVNGYHGAPFAVLGPHLTEVDGTPMLALRAFRPLDDAVFVMDGSGQRTRMTRWDEAGFFEAILPAQEPTFRYRLIVVDKAGNEFELEDPYRFPPLLTEYDLYLYGEGNFFYAYEKLGAHPTTIDGVPGVNFAVWAPNAQRVSLVGPFNGWDDRANPMRRHEQSGVWELFFPHLPVGMHYKFAVLSRFMGYEIDKADPFGFYGEMRPSTPAPTRVCGTSINTSGTMRHGWRRGPNDKGLTSRSTSMKYI
jgi:1,4-alpha-glucan branching enzyme